MSDVQCPICGKCFMGHLGTTKIPAHNCVTDSVVIIKTLEARIKALESQLELLEAEHEAVTFRVKDILSEWIEIERCACSEYDGILRGKHRESCYWEDVVFDVNKFLSNHKAVEEAK